MKHLPVKLYLFIIASFFLTFGYFFQGGGWTQNSRFCLTRAIIHQQSFAIDAYREDSKDPYYEFVNTGDWSYYDGHYYSNKSPGLSFLAVLPFALCEYLCGYIYPDDEGKQVHISAYVSTVFTVGICAALLCFLIFYTCHHFFDMHVSDSLIAAGCCGFGTLIFAYGTSFYCHVPAAFFSFLSFFLGFYIKHVQGIEPRAGKILAILSGFSASLAVLTEPSTVLTLGCIALYYVTFPGGRKALPYFLIGCVPCGIIQCFYNAACFGGPFNSSYAYANDLIMVYVDGSLFGVPRLRNLAELTIFPYRGLFVSSPLLLMALPGLFFFLRSSRFSREGVFFGVVSLCFLFFVASFYAWYGGTAPGPRYLIPAYPFIFMLTVFVLRKFRKIYLFFGVISLVVNVAITLVGSEVPGNIKNPLGGIIFKNLLAGNVSINPIPVSGFHDYPGIDTMTDIKLWQNNFQSFNLGELLVPYHIASIIPLCLLWGLLLGICYKKYLKKVCHAEDR